MIVVGAVVTLACFVAPLVVLGRYGWRNAERLAVVGGIWDEHRFRVLRRGSVACLAVAGFFLVSSVAFVGMGGRA
jgi:hypothetical protein